MLITYSLANTSQTLHTHTCLTALFPRLTRWAGTRKVKPIWILLKQVTVNSSGISWASTPPLCFYRPDALPATQPTASKHWRQENVKVTNIIQKKTSGKPVRECLHLHTSHACTHKVHMCVHNPKSYCLQPYVLDEWRHKKPKPNNTQFKNC